MIRPMTMDDLPQVFAIEKELFASYWSQRDFEYELSENEFARLFVKEVDGKVVGFVGIREIFDRGEITNLAVSSAYQGQGYGEEMLLYAVDKMRYDNMEAVFLEVRVSNRKALALYYKHGFIVMRTRKSYYTDNYEDAYEMAKAIGGNL